MELGRQAPDSAIDYAVFNRLKRLGVRPAASCSDEVFLRRAYLDVIGTLPTAQEARDFLFDKRPDKRQRLVDQLLQRDEYADYWALKWSDILRVKSEFPINLWPLAAQAYHRWIRTALRDNWPYDRFARALLLSSGSNFRNPEVNFFRAVSAKNPEGIAKAVALTFLGERAEKWPRARLAAMSGFFSQVAYKSTGEWKEEIVFNDPAKPLPSKAAFPDGKPAKLAPGSDPRKVFCAWLTGPDNPSFAKNIVNRSWWWLMGRGIVHEPDDIRADNPASNPELLAALEKALVQAKYDLKQVFGQILNSRAYQLSAVPATTANPGTDDFSHYRIRRLDAEVLIDAINQITGMSESYSSITPEPFTFIPEENRTIALADGSITSAFLDMFGRPARDTGFETERNNRPSAAQRLHLLNSSHIQRKIERGPKTVALIGSAKSQPDLVDQIHLTILSRFPSPAEKQTALDHLKRAGQTTGANDLIWAAINSSEFLYRH